VGLVGSDEVIAARTVPDRIARGVVGIFSLSSHSVIIIITLWTWWTLMLLPAPIEG
jgi:hypothetical protein